MHKALLAVFLLGATTLGGCSEGILDPQGPIASAERLLLFNSTEIMLVVVIPVIVATLGFAWWYRASNARASRSSGEDYEGRVEFVIWSIPALIVILLGGVNWISTHELDPRAPIQSKVQPLQVEVVALDWKWLFIYPDQRIAAVNQLVLPAGTPVSFRITSATVMNSFFIPQLGSQVYAMGGMQTKLSLMASRAGRYAGLSANYSGGGFSDMKFQAIASDEPSYERWIAKVKAAPQSLSDDVYLALAKPSEKHPVEYFSSVAPDLFDRIVHDTKRKPAATAMLGAAVCVANKE
jgi:cytochrome o ubiquinol oxidase subunit II